MGPWIWVESSEHVCNLMHYTPNKYRGIPYICGRIFTLVKSLVASQLFLQHFQMTGMAGDYLQSVNAELEIADGDADQQRNSARVLLFLCRPSDDLNKSSVCHAFKSFSIHDTMNIALSHEQKLIHFRCNLHTSHEKWCLRSKYNSNHIIVLRSRFCLCGVRSTRCRWDNVLIVFASSVVLWQTMQLKRVGTMTRIEIWTSRKSDFPATLRYVTMPRNGWF